MVSADAKESEPVPTAKLVQSAAYKTILFDLYTKDYFSALVKFDVASSRDQLAMTPREKDQFRAGLLMSYGVHDEARKLLRGVVGGPSSVPAMKSMGWYYAAKAAYRARDLEGTWVAANEIKDGLPPDLAAEVVYWKVEYLIAIGRYDDATRVFAKMLKGTEWHAYAMFNLGVAQLRTGQLKEGLSNLVAVGRPVDNSSNMLALADKANLTVGYYYLRERKAAPSIEALTRVRLIGPFSNKALLGLGWAHSFERRYAEALVPWTELRKRNSTDVTVQESMLATPYAYAQVSAPAQAVKFYEEALGRYIAVQTLIENSTEATDQGVFFAPLFEAPPFDDVTLSRRLQEQGADGHIGLVSELFGQEDFQSLFRSYRDVWRLKSNLDEWIVRLDILLSGSKRVDPGQKSGGDRRASLVTHGRQLKDKYNKAVTSRDTLVFAEPKEVTRYGRLALLQQRLDHLGAEPQSEQIAQRLRIQKGLLQWDLNATFDPRARKTGTQLGDALAKLASPSAKNGTVTTTTSAVLSSVESLERYGVMKSRAAALSDRCAVLLRGYQKLIQEDALAELNTKRRFATAYLAQARYGAAQIYDEANSKPVPKK